MKFTYKNHRGESIDFFNSPYILTNHAFLDWTLNYQTINGINTDFRMSPQQKSFTVRIAPDETEASDREEAFAEAIDNFVHVVSADLDTPGQLWTDQGEYLSCRIITSNKSEWMVYGRNVTIACVLLTERPVWVSEHNYTFEPEEAQTYEYLDYNYGFLYDFMAKLPGYSGAQNSGTEPANFRLKLYQGTNPFVVMNGIKVGVNTMIGEDEYVLIDSSNQTVTKYKHNGITENLFNLRTKGEKSIFERLPVGDISLMWNGAFAFDLTILEERREAKWTLSLQTP